MTSGGSCSSPTTASQAAEREILLDDSRPSWVGAPVYKTDDVAVYPVCTDPADTRCASAVAVR